MREILFRGKRIDNGEWIEGFLAIWGDDYYIAPAINAYTSKGGRGKGRRLLFGEYFLVNPETVGQYTDLTDKNGKKIFEGNILSIAQNSDGMGQYYYPPIPYPAHVVVKWDLCSWMWEVIGKDKYYLSFPDAWCHYDCEVIGNICDNPELLDNSELLEDKL